MNEVLVNRIGSLSLPRKSVVRLTDRPYMTLDVYRGRKTTTQQRQLFCSFLRKRPMFYINFSPAALTPPTTVSVPLPENWAVWDLAHPFELIELDGGQVPYNDVMEQFYKTLDKAFFNIVNIYRVQNPLLWSAYTK